MPSNTPGKPDPPSELVEILGASDEIVDVVTRSQMRRNRLRHRCTFVVVRSSSGQVLIHRRSLEKDLWGGYWDLCAGGVVGVGEEWHEAAARELNEELGIADCELTPLGQGSYRDEDVDELGRVWTTVHDGPFEFADGEVLEACFVTVAELLHRLEGDPFVPDSRALVLPFILGNSNSEASLVEP